MSLLQPFQGVGDSSIPLIHAISNGDLKTAISLIKKTGGLEVKEEDGSD